jgi:hypothetical protein
LLEIQTVTVRVGLLLVEGAMRGRGMAEMWERQRLDVKMAGKCLQD